MAWALRFDGGNDVLTLSSAITNPIPVGGKLYYEGVYQNNGKSFQMFVNTYEPSVGNRDFLSINSAGNLVARVDEVIGTGTATLSDGDTFVVEVERDSSNYYFYLDTVLQFTIAKSVNMDSMLGFSNSTYESKGDLISCYLTDADGTTKLYKWSPDDSDHSNTGLQPLLVETVGGNDATGVNFPTDGSAWIDLGGSSNDSDVDIEIIKPEFSVAATVDTVANSADIDFDILSPLFNSTATVTNPGFNANADIVITQPEFSAQAVTDKPQFDSDIDFDVSKPVFSVDASNGVKVYNTTVDFDVSKPLFSSSATTSKPQFIADVDTEITKPEFSVVAQKLNPGNNSSVDFGVTKPIFNSAANNTKPNYNAIVDFDVTKPQFSVNAINGIITFTFSEETNYNQPTLGTNYNQPYLSTNYEK